MLWRITHGEFAQTQNPQFVVLVMGINNILHKFRELDRQNDDDDDTADMVRELPVCGMDASARAC